MKKTLVAIAALAATGAFAQSSVTLYGNIDQAVYHGSTYNGSNTSSASNAGSTSLWGIKGLEDLGGGTRVGFDLKSELTLASGQTGSSTTTAAAAASNANVFNRAAWLGIENDNAGSFKIGRQNDVWWEQTTQFNNTGINSFGWANATAMASGTTSLPLLYTGAYVTAPSVNGLAGYGAASTLASPNASAQGSGAAFFGGLSYQTPTWMGLTAKIQRGVPKAYYDSASNVGQISGTSVTYAQGPLSVAYGTNTKTDTAGNKAMQQTMLGAKYVWDKYTFTGALNQTRMGGLTQTAVGSATTAYTTTSVFQPVAHDVNITALGVGYQLTSAWKLDVGYTVMKDATDSANKFTQTGVVGTYAMSKRTSFYAGYGQGSNSGASRYGSVYAGSANTQPGVGSGGSVNATNPVTSAMTGQGDKTVMAGLRHQF